MKTQTVKFLAFLFSFFLLSISAMPICAESNSELNFDYTENAQAVYLYSYDADRVILHTGKQKLISPGPTAKIMTGLIVCEEFEDNLDKKILITPQMLKGVEGNIMGLCEGMKISVLDLLYGAVCGGNNDAAQALALICADSISSFADKMNSYAQRLYMKNTVYANPTGMDDPAAKTTIEDVAILARKAADSLLYTQISTAQNHEMAIDNSKTITIYNRNALVSQFSAQGYINKSAKGLIAGRDDNGFSLAALFEKDGMRCLCIVMSADLDGDEIYSYYIANNLFDYFIKNYEKTKIAEKGDAFKKIGTKFTLADEEKAYAYCVLPNDVYAVLPYDADLEKDLSCKAYLHQKNINAPAMQGTVVGGVDIYYKNILVAKSELVIEDELQANNILIFLENAKSFLTGRFFISFVIIAAISVTAFLIVDKRSHHHRARKRRFY